MSEDDQELLITQRCRVDDLRLPADSSGRAERHVAVHQVVRAFVERRSQAPTGQETFQCATEATGKTIYTLHSGTDRGATWHDVDDEMEIDIVWLLGCRPNHDYDALCDLAYDDVLLPGEADYEAKFDEDVLTLAKALVEEVPALLEEAERRKGQVVEGTLAERIPVRLYRDPDDEAPLLTVAIRTFPLRGTTALKTDWFARVVLAFFKRNPADLSTTDALGDDPLREGESAFCDFPEN